MALSPGEIAGIAQGVAEVLAPFTVAGVALAVVSSILIGIFITARFAKRYVMKEQLREDGPLKELRDRERNHMVLQVDGILEARLKELPTVPDHRQRLAGLEDKLIDLANREFPVIPDYGERLDSLEKSLQPFLAEAEITYADGSKKQGNELLATIQSLPATMIASMNDWLASDEAKGMLAKRRMAAEKQAREALGEFQEQVAFADANPALAARGARLQKVEAAAKKYLDRSKLSPEVKSLFNEGIELAKEGMQKGGGSDGSSGSGANWVTDI